MSTIRQKSKTSYQLIAYERYDNNNVQKRRYRTWTIPAGMTPAAARKAAQRAADEFEASLRGRGAKERIKFSAFVQKWLDSYAVPQLKPKTVDGYVGLLPVLQSEFGTLYLDEIDAAHLAMFYAELRQTRKQSLYCCPTGFSKKMTDCGFTRNSLRIKADVAKSVITSAIRGNNIRPYSAQKIADAMGRPLAEVFMEVPSDQYLDATTVLHYHRVMSSILQTAVTWGYLKENPAHIVATPRKSKKPIKYLQPDDVFALIDAMDRDQVPAKYRMALLMLVLTGMRREELLATHWHDIDFDKGTLEVVQAVGYIRKKGLQFYDTKTTGSYRVIPLPDCLLRELMSYREYKDKQLEPLGLSVKNSDYLFQAADGHLLWPSTVTTWVRKFYDRHPELQRITPHGLRHTNASIQLNNNTPLPAVAEALGHANTQTTAAIYAHVIQSAKVAAAREVDSILAPYLRAQ